MELILHLRKPVSSRRKLQFHQLKGRSKPHYSSRKKEEHKKDLNNQQQIINSSRDKIRPNSKKLLNNNNNQSRKSLKSDVLSNRNHRDHNKFLKPEMLSWQKVNLQRKTTTCTWALRLENSVFPKGKNSPLLLKLKNFSLGTSYKNIVQLRKMK